MNTESRPKQESERPLIEHERKPIAQFSIDFARHSIKSKLPDGREPLAAQGVTAAVESRAHEKATHLGQVFGSWRERTGQSSVLRKFAEHFKEVDFVGIDPQDIVAWLQEGGLQKTETPLFDFAEGEGDYNKEYLDALLKNNNFFEWMATQSDRRAIETKQDPEKTAPFSVYAGNVATFIFAEVWNQYEHLGKGGEGAEKGIDFATSHQGIIESFLYKVMLLKGADKKAMDEFWKKNTQGFKENEGIKIQVNVYDKDDAEAWNVRVEYDGHTYELEPKDLFAIIQDSNDLKEKLKALRKDTE